MLIYFTKKIFTQTNKNHRSTHVCVSYKFMYRTQSAGFTMKKKSDIHIGYNQAEYALGTQVFRKKPSHKIGIRVYIVHKPSIRIAYWLGWIEQITSCGIYAPILYMQSEVENNKNKIPFLRILLWTYARLYFICCVLICGIVSYRLHWCTQLQIT